MEPGSRVRRARHRSIGRVAAVTVAALVVLAGPACSKDDGGDDAAASTTVDVNVDPPNDPPTTTAPSSATTVADTAPAQTTTTAAVSGEPFGGTVDGEQGTAEIGFTKADGAIRNFTVRGLEIQCLPMAGGEASTRTIDVVLDRVPVGADGMVDYIAEDADYAPELSGSFADDGRFIGGLYLSEQMGDAVCGGEFTFALGG